MAEVSPSEPLPMGEAMRRKQFAMICLGIIVVLSICFFIYKTNEKTVILCDYSNIAVDISECYITKNELDTAISLQLSALGSEETLLTNEVAQLYFKSTSAEKARESIIYEIVKNRYYESLYFQTLELSYVDEKILNEYAEQTYEQLLSTADEKGLSLSQYLDIDVFDEEVFMKTLRSMQKERLILDEIIQKEKIDIPSEDEILTVYEFDSTLNALETEYLKYTIKYTAVEQHLLTLYYSEIENYFNIIKNDLL